jgi:hypothetical protein
MTVIKITLNKGCLKIQVQRDEQRPTKHTHKTKDRVTRAPLKSGCEPRCS